MEKDSVMDMNIDSKLGTTIERIAPISRQIWDAKYRLKTADGTPVDVSIEDSWRRVARALAAVEANPDRWEQPFYTQFTPESGIPLGL
jgi:ribonucleoside-diphosphate reductase alpha chain